MRDAADQDSPSHESNPSPSSYFNNPHHPDSAFQEGLSGTRYTHEQRVGYKILHDFLAAFPPTQITFFRFEWIGQLAGPNPLLLHNLPVEATGRDTWFSAPPLEWKAIEILRLKGVDLKDEDVIALRTKNRGLKSLILETYWTEDQIEQGLASEDPEEKEIDVLVEEEW